MHLLFLLMFFSFSLSVIILFDHFFFYGRVENDRLAQLMPTVLFTYAINGNTLLSGLFLFYFLKKEH